MSGFGIRSTVFDSKAERDVYVALSSRWSPPYRVYPQLPLSKILGTAPSDATGNERRFFYETNVDYTLCDTTDRPLLSVDFDGLGQGFSREGRYIREFDVESDPNRGWKLDYKLLLAEQVKYPFFVVSYDETRTVEAGETLCILDGVVASVLTRGRTDELSRELFTEHVMRGGQPDSIEVETILSDASTLAELEIDPFESQASRIEFDLRYRHDVLDSVDVQQYHRPTVPDGGDWNTLEGLRALEHRYEALKKAKVHGTRVVVRLKGNYPATMRNISVRAVGDWFTALSLSERIAKYLALKHAHSFLQANPACYL